MTRYIGDDLHFHCYHPQHSYPLSWFIDEESLMESELLFHITIRESHMMFNFSSIIVENITNVLNQSEIHCGGYNAHNVFIRSLSATIYLQGKNVRII